MHIRRKYSQEYKQEAVQLVRQSDIPLAQAATNLGINPGMLRRWRARSRHWYFFQKTDS